MEDLTEAMGELFTLVHPLWCLPVAALAWYLVARIAPPETELTKNLKPIFNMFGYLVGFAVLVGGAVGWTERLKRAGFGDANANVAWVRSLTWREFEECVAEVYRSQGFAVELLGGSGPDDGIDLRMQREGMTYVVQCKPWKSQKVGVKPIRELFGVMAAESADHGIFIASGRYTKEAGSFASGKNLELVGGDGFLRLIRQFQRTVRGESAVHDEPENVAVERTDTSPACPVCGTAMKLRTARQGASAGQQFWGCSQFPTCRGTRKIS